ncbi:hypothetical protein VX159_05295 [Dechloromonas sp. ZY10]|uniref:hypothetical protein n=1 Tax=Dechloromonas aquae TaxID=2664436 RepID=UPI003527D9E4
MMSTTAIASPTQAQEAYRSQLAQARSERQLSGLSRSLDEAARIGKVVGADTNAAVSARQRLESPTSAPVESTRVSISREAQARLQAEQNQTASNAASQTQTNERPQRQSFRSLDEAIAYGTRKATEQAARQVGTDTQASNGNSRPATARSEQQQQARSAATLEASTREATVPGRSNEQLTRATTSPATASAVRNATSSSASEASSSAGRNERVQFRSVNDAIAYGATRAAEQARAAQAPESAGRSNNSSDNLRVGQSNASDTRNRDLQINGETQPYATRRALELYASQGGKQAARI